MVYEDEEGEQQVCYYPYDGLSQTEEELQGAIKAQNGQIKRIIKISESLDSSFDEFFDWSVFGKYAPIENR